MKQIIHVFDVKAPRERVYEALTTQRGLAGWWTADVTADVRVGGKIDFRFGSVFHPVMEVAKLEPGRAVEWKCVGGEKDWQDNRFVFRMEDRGGMTLVSFLQDYARELSDEVYGRQLQLGLLPRQPQEVLRDRQGLPLHLLSLSLRERAGVRAQPAPRKS